MLNIIETSRYKGLNKGFENSTLGECSGHHIGTGRHNGNHIDLNRAFPTWDDVSLSKNELMERSEPEVAAVVDWVLSQPFVLSANFHDGAVVVNYPYDDSYLSSGQEVGKLHFSKLLASKGTCVSLVEV